MSLHIFVQGLYSPQLPTDLLLIYLSLQSSDYTVAAHSAMTSILDGIEHMISYFGCELYAMMK